VADRQSFDDVPAIVHSADQGLQNGVAVWSGQLIAKGPIERGIRERIA
jgi:hypothetical protein